jgi:hypothetical protein
MASLLEEALPERAVREPETAGPDTRLLHGLVGEVILLGCKYNFYTNLIRCGPTWW